MTTLIEIDKHLFEPITVSPNTNIIQSSPYTDSEHLLDLTTLEYEYQILAKALTKFTVTNSDYALAPYSESFNIEEVITAAKNLAGKPLRDFKVYIVAFRSRLRHEVQVSAPQRQILGEIDKASHAEANQSGGLLKYFFGSPDSAGNNLATCWWVDKSAAKVGGGGKAHREGVQIVRNWYAKWQVEEYEVDITEQGNRYEIYRL